MSAYLDGLLKDTSLRKTRWYFTGG